MTLTSEQAGRIFSKYAAEHGYTLKGDVIGPKPNLRDTLHKNAGQKLDLAALARKEASK